MKNRITLHIIAALTAATQGSGDWRQGRELTLKRQRAWEVYAAQPSRYEKNARRSQRQKRRDARRALANGYNLKAA